MKKYIKFVVVMAVFIVLISCTRILEKTPKIDNFNKLDLTKYTEKGFLFSPYLYNGDYEAVGLINYKFIPSATYKHIMIIDTTYYGDFNFWVNIWEKDRYELYGLLDSIYTWSISKGGNAIIDLKMNVTSEYFGYGYNNPAYIDGIEITGFAIKRK